MLSGSPGLAQRASPMTAPTPLLIRLGIWAWLIAALVVGHFQWLQRSMAPVVPVLTLTLASLVLLAYFRLPPVRAWFDGLDLRALVLLHVTRFVGLYVLVLYARGMLPYALAVPAGWGNTLAAALALVVCFTPLAPAGRLRAISIWNMIGFADILLVVLSGLRLGLADPGRMRALGTLPLSLLPTFLAPLMLAIHVIIFLRVRQALAPGLRHAS